MDWYKEKSDKGNVNKERRLCRVEADCRYSCVLSVEVNDGNFRRNQQISEAVEHINTHDF